jgi:hypothetical protein
MSRAVYKFFNRQDNQLVDVVEFDLIDNPGCRAWQYAVMLNDKSRDLIKSPPIKLKKNLPDNIVDLYENLKQVIRTLSNTEFSYNHDIPESFDLVTQDHMNKLHRHFTNSCSTLWNPSYANTLDFTLDKVLHDLNQIVHDLEIYIPTATKLKYCHAPQEVWLINHGRELGYDIFPFRQYHSYDPADLILDGYILGKTLIESFACHDDPTSWDTAGHMKTNGGSIIVVGDTRQQIYNSLEFIEWLRNYGVEKHQRLADFPLGYFVPGHRSKLESLQKDVYKYSVQVNIVL